MAEKPITTAPYSTGVSGNYYIFVNDNGELRQVDIDIISKFLGNISWSTLTGKPFNNIDGDEFTVSGETLKIKGYHTHNNAEILNNFALNEDGALVYDGSIIGGYVLPVATAEVLGGVKPDGTTIKIDEDGTIHGANTYELPIASNTVLGGVKIDGDTIKMNDGVISADVIGNWSAGVSYPVGYFVVYNDKLYECIKANSDTEWTESNWTPIGSVEGIGINNWSANTLYKVGDLVINGVSIYQCNIEHTSVETFDETKWTALSGAKGDKGDDGFSPTANVAQTETGCTITIVDKNGTTTADLANGTDGVSPTASVTQTESGCTVTITDGSGTTTADLTNGINGENGTTPHIDESTKHWFIGDIDTGITAEGVTTIATTSANYTGTLSVDNWIGDTAPYTQSVTINGIAVDVAPFIDLIVSDDITIGKEEMTQWGYITKATTSDNTIIFSCYENKPTIDLNFKVKVV